jgi:hypothetical protein
MEIRDLVESLLRHDDLAARQWVKTAAREGVPFASVPRPEGLDTDGLAIAAGVLELLAERRGEPPPDWTRDVGPASREIWLSRYAERIPVLRERCLRFGPVPLRSRRVLALPDAFTIA